MNGTQEQLFDLGLQPERTLLAWRRTCLAFAVVCLAVVRFAADRLGAPVVVGGIVGAGLALFAYTLTAWKYRRAHTELLATGALSQGGGALMLVTGAMLTLGGLSAVFVISGFADGATHP